MENEELIEVVVGELLFWSWEGGTLCVRGIDHSSHSVLGIGGEEILTRFDDIASVGV